MIYTVDEVSDLLSIPRPTLYRYLREYSIPHVRRSGKISIPEESFDRIKEARELHREGLGTVSVRRRMREVNDPVDTEELTERLDRLSGALQSLQGDLLMRPVDGVSSSSQEETLQTVLEKQDLLILAVSNLTGMVEDLLSTNVRPRAAAFDGVDEGTGGEKALPEQYGGSLLTIERDVETDDSVTQDLSKSVEYFTAPTGREKFGTLARRRRRVILALLLVVAASVALAWGPLDLGGRVFGQPVPDEQSSVEEDSQSAPATDEEVPQAPPSVEVPDLVGMTLPDAEDKLADAGLKLGAWNEIPTYESSQGRVVTQGPQAGEEADPDSPVDLIVSAAPPAYQPDTTGRNVGGVAQYPGGVSQPSNQGNLPPAPF